MTILESLNWRYATKRMNGQKVPQEKVDTILEAARLAPTVSGLQPFRILVVADPGLLKKIQPIANNQPQITEASHLLIFAAYEDITDRQVEEALSLVEQERGLPPGSQDAYKNRLKDLFGGMTQEQRFQTAARQAYIAFGVAITAAAMEEVDATPMGGFNSEELDKLLHLKEKGLRSVTLLTLGYRDTENDRLASLKKVRKPKEELVLELGPCPTIDLQESAAFH